MSGKADVVEFNRFIPMGGELGRSITDDGGKLITENKVEMPALRTYTTPIFVAVKSGVPTSVEIDGPVKGTRLTLTAKWVDSSGRAILPTLKER